MKRHFVLVSLAVTAALAAEGPIFPETPYSEDTLAPNTATGRKLNFCIIDNGGWGRMATPTKFWIDASGRVCTQAFEIGQNERAKKKKFTYEDIRYRYQLAPDEFSEFQSLIDRLRVDARVLRERALIAGERTRWIAFSMSPYADLFIREKHASDQWEEFSAVSTLLSRIHASKKQTQEPSYVGVAAWGALWWEPPGFVSDKVIGSLRYIGSKRYNSILDNRNQESEQGSAEQPATRSQSNSEGSDKPQPESEGRSR